MASSYLEVYINSGKVIFKCRKSVDKSKPCVWEEKLIKGILKGNCRHRRAMLCTSPRAQFEMLQISNGIINNELCERINQNMRDDDK